MIVLLAKTLVIETAKKVPWKIVLKKVGIYFAREGSLIVVCKVADKVRQDVLPVRHLRKLDEMKAKGVVTTDEYSKKRSEILDGMFAGPR